MHEPYLDGYSVLPRMRRIERNEIFEPDSNDLSRFRELKQEAMRRQIWCVERDCSAELKTDVLAFFRDCYPRSLPDVSTLEELAPALAEDFVIQRYDPTSGRDWMAFGAVFFPSDWRPEEKVGRSYNEIHAPVPGIKLDGSEKLVETLIHAGPFERFVWSVVFEPRVNGHPRIPRRRFDAAAPQVWVKVERQVTVGFPNHHATLFIFNQSMIPETDINKPALAEALRGMTLEQRIYKGIAADCDSVIAWLSEN